MRCAEDEFFWVILVLAFNAKRIVYINTCAKSLWRMDNRRLNNLSLTDSLILL